MPASSIRSYLRLNTPALFVREERGIYRLRDNGSAGLQTEIKYGEERRNPFTFGRDDLPPELGPRILRVRPAYS